MSFRIATAYVAVEADDSALRADITAKVKAAADGAVGNVRLDVDGEGLAEKVRADAEAADAETHVKVKVDDTGASDLRQGIERLGDDVAGDADAAGSRIGSALGNGLFRDANGYIRNSSGQFATEAEKLAAGFETAGNSAQSAGNKAANSGANFHLAAVGVGTLAAAGVSLIPVLAAIPAAAAAAAAGVAVLGGAFGGVTKALHDYGAMDSSVGGGGGGGQTAATAYSDAVAVRNAEQAITDARTQAARGALQAAEQVANAQQGVQDAERNAASAAQQAAGQIVSAQRQVTQAAYAGVQAEQAYTNAVYNEQQANLTLVNARLAAANQLVDSQNSAADAHLATEQAALNANTAQEALTAGQGNSLLTTDQQAQLSLAAQQATQALADAKQHEKEATEAANAATSAGVDKAPTVLSAQHAAEQAAQATANAQHGIQTAAQQAADAQTNLAKAQQAAANQQVTANEQIGKAEQSLADAERQQAQQRSDSAEQIAKAQQNLTDTIKEQQLQAASGGAAGSAAVNQFAKDMANLSPAGQAFVKQLISMKGELHNLALEAQTATLPGFTQMLKDSQHLLPTVQDGIQRTGKAFSDTAASVGELFANPAFDDAALHFEKIVTGGFAEVMSGLPPLLNSIVTSGVQAAPLINAVAVGIHDILSSGLPAFLSGLTVNAGGAAQGVGALFHAVDGLLGPVGTLAGAASGALGPALATLEPGFLKLVDDIEAGLLPLMPQLSTDLVDVAQILDQLFLIAEPIIPVLSNGLGGALRILDPILQDTATFLRENASWLTPVAEGALAVYAAVKLWGGVSSLAESGVKALKGTLDKFSSAAETAAGKAGSVADAFGGTAGLASKLGIVGMITGEVATGIIGVGEALNHVLYKSSNVASSVDQFTEALLNSEAATDNATIKLDSYAQMAQGVGSANSHVTDSMAQTGLGMIELGRATFMTEKDMTNYDASLAALVSSGNADRAKTIVDQLAAATDAHGKKIVTVNQDLPQYSAAVEKAGVDAQTTARSTQSNADATQNLAGATQNATDRFQYMTSTMSQSQALDGFHTQLLNLKTSLDQNGASLDNSTAKGLANRSAFSQAAQQIENYGSQLSQAGTPAGLVALKMQDMVTQLEDQAGKFGYNKQQVDAYVKSIGLVPSSVETTLTTNVAVQVNQELLQAAAQNIGHVVGHYLVPGQAAGGLVTGPGTGTSDSVLRRLSAGEFVVPAAATAHIGLAGMEQIRNGQIPQVGGTTAQASAPVINLNYYGTQQPTVEQQQVLMRDLALAVRG